MTEQALQDVAVLDLSCGVAGAYCTKLLADLGAEVWKLEPPEGDPVRRLGPFRNGKEDPEQGGLHLHLNANKRSLVVDLESPQGRDQILQLAGRVDVLVESFSPGLMAGLGLGYDDLAPLNPGLIFASLRPFGQTGPWRDWLGEEIVDAAVGGYMYFTGHPEKPPLMMPGFQGELQLGMQAALAVLAALHYQRDTGSGQYIDASGMEAFLSAHSWLSTAWSHTGQVLRRSGSDLTPCVDGSVFYFQAPFRPEVLLLFDRPELLDDPRFADHPSWVANAAVVRELWDEWCKSRTKQEIYHAAQELRVAVSPVNTVADLVDSAQMQARAWFEEVDHPRAGRVTLPGFPYKLSGTPPRIDRPAPLLGEGGSGQTFGVIGVQGSTGALRLDATGTSRLAVGSREDTEATQTGASVSSPTLLPTAYLPTALSGVRVIEMTANWAGPFAGRLLADLGAEVIKIELASKPATRGGIYAGGDPMNYHYNRAGYFNKLNRNKYGISLNVAHPKGKDVFWRLLRRADVVIENNSARVMRNLGLDYEQLRAVNPRVTLVSMSGFGATGPESNYSAYGSSVEASCGLVSLTGYRPGENYRTTSYYPDPITGGHGAIAALAAMHARRRTGEGQFVDIALNEVAAGFFAEAIMDYSLNGTVPEPRGNRSSRCAPQGAYRCMGADSWVVLAVRDDAEFARLCEVMGRAELASDPAYSTHAARHANHDQLDEHVSAWTATVDHNEVARRLQAARVPAAPVLANWELLPNPHLFSRDFYVPIDHPEVGVYPFPGAPAKLSGTPVSFRMPAPLFAQHNDYVYRDLLGLTEAEMEDLNALGLIDSAPSTPVVRL